MVVLSLHAFVLVIILIAMMQAGCGTSSVRTASTSSASPRDRVRIDRIYNSPAGPDLYRVESPTGTTYHLQGYVSPIAGDVACEKAQP